jgi:predicted dehydrogenase
MPDRLGLGVFGYGLMAAAHAAVIGRTDDAALFGVCGPRPDAASAFAERFEIPFATSDPQALLDRPDVAAVLVDAADEAHCDLTLRSLAAGKHVLCEKPLAPTTEECRAMAVAARDAPVTTMVGFSNRRFPWLLAGKHLIDTGALGRVFHVHMQSFSPSMLKPGAARRWRADPTRAPAGVLGDLGSHYFDLLRFFFGEVIEVSADLRSLSDPSISSDDCMVLFRLEGDVHGSLLTGKLSTADPEYPPGRRHILISGSSGAVRLENGAGRFFPLQGEPVDLDVVAATGAHESYLAGSTAPTVRAFLDAVRSGAEATPTFVDGLRCQEVIEAALASNLSRRWEPVRRQAV